jgi:hypothetical protein
MAQYIKPLLTMDGEQRFEVMMLADKYGNMVGAANPTGMAVDAFGRARSSNPYTLFDSFHRYQDDSKIVTATSASGASATHDTNSSTVACTIDQTSGSYVYRESSRVFAYQPGKSLQILETFVLATPKENLRQRYGYFGTDNGVFLQTLGTEISFVIRSKSSGSVVENKVTQDNWNLDKLDGEGISGKTLDLTKAQILFIDIEWLGVGSVRMGFVIDGEFIHCHTFHHANSVTTTYMGTACLPIRSEIENIGATASSSTMRVICATVISEGGYELRGRARTVATDITADYTLTTAGTYYPVVAIRLKSTRLDGIVLPKNIHLLGTSNVGSYQYKIISGGTITGGTWSPMANSSVEYNITGTAITGGTDLVSGFTTVSNQSAPAISLDSGLFKYQLERNSFTSTPTTFILAVSPGQSGNKCVGALEWEEVV